MRITLAICLLMLVAVVGCNTTPAPKGIPLVSECQWKSFEAAVRQGPNKGLVNNGLVVLGQTQGNNTLYGMLFTADEKAVAVSGKVEGTSVTLNFHSTGGVMKGVGPLKVAGVFCQEGLTGDLTGPTANDSGDWKGDIISAKDLSDKCFQLGYSDGTFEVTCAFVHPPNSSGSRFTTCTTTYPPNGAPPSMDCR
jgi:hypothetical protein